MEAEIREIIANGFLILDGGMGTLLQKKNIQAGKYPELLNITTPEIIESIQHEYVEAGSRVIYTNTFGASRYKLAGSGYSPLQIIPEAVRIARKAAAGKARVALDIGPLGQLLEPLGSLKFEDAYDAFKEIVIAGKDADLIIIETIADLCEARAALLAAKENSDLPVFVTMSFEKNGRTYTGCTAESMACTLTGLGADAIGMNCSVGPDSAADIVCRIAEHTDLPVIAKPNAGLPDPVTGRFMTSPEQFAEEMKACIASGATIIGGCCGTTPEYISRLSRLIETEVLPVRSRCRKSAVCTATKFVPVDGVKIVGERINPTGKKRFQQALKDNDLDYILSVGISQMDAGADILDVNVGYPGIDEVIMLPAVVKALQSVVDLPLQLDSANPEALEAALRIYNGKAVVNSVNGDDESLERILPIVKKYGASVIGLTLSSDKMPETAEERFTIARKIYEAARSRKIEKEDIWIDCLTLTVSAQPEQARETLKALRMVKSELGLKTLLGVSNISFGMPNRPVISQCFLAQALAMGLDLPIMNPNLAEMTAVVLAHRVLSCEDNGSRAYIEAFAENEEVKAGTSENHNISLESAIIRGLGEEAANQAEKLLKTGESELSIVESRLIPALDSVGSAYEKGTMYLPQLLSSAQAAQSVFEVLKSSVLEKGGAPLKKGTIALATVQGDIHDIGKNIVKTILENYGYSVSDLGKDVPPEEICRVVEEQGIRLVGLSALMTTTLPSMEKTVKMLHKLPNSPVVMVGGAVVTADYARSIGADYYAKDARKDVEIAREVLG